MYEHRRDYGEKRDYPKIELFVSGIYHSTTTWAKTLTEAKHEMARTLGIDVREITASYKDPK